MLFHGDCEYLQSYLIVNESDIEPVKLFVKNTLLLYMKDHQVHKLQYELILNQIRVKDDPDTLWKIVIALSNYTYLLTHHSSDHFSSLLQCIFSYDWKCEFKVSVAIIYLINQIVSTNATFLNRAFNLYVHSLLPPTSTNSSSAQRTIHAEINHQNQDSTTSTLLQQHRKLVHKAMKSIIDQVPTGRSILFPILSDFFPHKRFSCMVQTEYVEQLIHICKYEPTLQYRILELIIKKCLEMDVEIAIDDTGDALIDTQDIDDNDDNEDNELFPFDADHNPKAAAATSSSMNKSTTHRVSRHIGSSISVRNSNQLAYHSSSQVQSSDGASYILIPPEVAELADKLDSMLILVIGFFKDEIYSNNSDRLFQQLLSIFESAVLSIHKSKFVQFCIFYAASLNISFAQSITERLLSIVIGQQENYIHNNNTTTQKQQPLQSSLGVTVSTTTSTVTTFSCSNIHKQSAVMYLSSYLSRAMFLSIDYVNDVVNRLLLWASNYAKRSLSTSYSNKAKSVVDFDEYGRIITTNSENNSISKHELFYSVVQSICYILCFYGVELAIKQCRHPDIVHHWESIVLCNYDPLKYCLKSVRMEFLKLASCTELLKDECCQRLPQEWFYTSEMQLAINTNEDVKTSTLATATTTTDNTTIATTGTSTSLANAAAMHTNQSKHNISLYHPIEETKYSNANKLDSFFPFDPCLLYKVHQTIQDSYRVWQGGVPGLDELMNNCYDASSVDDEDDIDDDEDDGSSVLYDEQVTDSEHMNLSINDRTPKKVSGKDKKKKSKDVNIFATSSLSSVVTSLAGTDFGVSANNSMLMNTTTNTNLLLDKSILPREPSDEDDDDDDIHDEHMPIPVNHTVITVHMNNNLFQEPVLLGCFPNSNNNNEDMQRYTGIRRPRFYSIGSTGSW